MNANQFKYTVPSFGQFASSTQFWVADRNLTIVLLKNVGSMTGFSDIGGLTIQSLTETMIKI